MTPPSPSRPYLVMRRWVSMIACGVIGAAVVLVSEPGLGRVAAPIADRLGEFTPSQFALLFGALAGAACWSVARGRWGGFVGVRHVLSYPPLSVSVAIGAMTWAAGTAWFDSVEHLSLLLGDARWFWDQTAPWIRALLVIAIAAMVMLPIVADVAASAHARRDRAGKGARYCNEQSGAEQQGCGQTSGIPRTFDTLRCWVKDDEPISSPEGDLFHHDAIATRIVSRLSEPAAMPTIALIGPLGSGKTTIRRLVSHHLAQNPKVHLVSISMWPFDSPEAAMRGILSALVRELGKRVNILPLVGLSDKYVAAIEKSAGGFGGLAGLLRTREGPAELVETLTEIATAAGLRLVLWIEDLERFSGGDQLEGFPAAVREVERLGAIRALLHLLDSSTHVSVVVSDVSLRTRFDLSKLARFIEQVPAMEEADVGQAILILREGCLGGFPHPVIDPASPEIRELLTPDVTMGGAWALFRAFRDVDSLIDAAVKVLGTPRSLKSALRITLETWESLPGEIDFDSVLIASILRQARPQLFALISDNIVPFQHGLRDPLGVPGERREAHPVVAQIDDLLAHEVHADASSLRALLAALFPTYPPGRNTDDRNYIKRPQALSVDSHVNYWRRYLSSDVVTDNSDQDALKSIGAWLNGSQSDLLDRLRNERRAGQIETFVGQFRPLDLCALLKALAEAVITESARNWGDRAHAPGLTSVWRMMLALRPPDNQVAATVTEIVRDVAPRHLPLAHDVVYFFTESSSDGSSLMSPEDARQVRTTLHQSIRDNFIGEGAEDRLAIALQDGAPWVVSWVAWGLPRIRANDRNGLPFPEWPQFAETLLRLATKQPDLGLQVIVPFVTQGHLVHDSGMNDDGSPRRSSAWVRRFDAEGAARLFEIDRLLPMLAGWTTPAEVGDEFRALSDAAIEGARAALRARAQSVDAKPSTDPQSGSVAAPLVRDQAPQQGEEGPV